MGDWLKILLYRDFYDVPRAFIISVNSALFLFDCPFDEARDDYPDSYQIYKLPQKEIGELPLDWRELAVGGLKHIGVVPIAGVRFDPSRRSCISLNSIRALK